MSRKKFKSVFVTRAEKKFALELTNRVIETAVIDGHLDPRAKKPEEFKKDVLKYLRRFIDGKGPVAWNIDFRSELIRQARRLRKQGNAEESILYYATWIEHMLNSMIAAIFRRRKLSDDWIRDFVRETGLRAKYTFVVTSLAEKAPSTKHVRAMREIADRRNQFVHYKWVYYEEEESDKQKKAYENALALSEAWFDISSISRNVISSII